MREVGLPALEYCSLERATRIIGCGCEVGDLIHWALIGKIRLAANFDNINNVFGLIFLSDDVDRIVEVIMEDKGSYDNEYYISPESIFQSHVIIDTEEDLRKYFSHRRFTDKEFNRPMSFGGCARGVWDIENLRYNDTYASKYRFDTILPLDGSFGIPVIASSGDYIGLDINELLISKKYIDLITGGEYLKSLELPYIERGENINIKLSNDDVNEEPRAKTEISIKNRAAFIKALLAINYGDDVAERPRSYVDNPRSELSKKFNLAGIDLPSGKTIEGWLKGIDIKKS